MANTDVSRKSLKLLGSCKKISTTGNTENMRVWMFLYRVFNIFLRKKHEKIFFFKIIKVIRVNFVSYFD